MRRNRWVLVALAALIALAGAWYWASPVLAMRQLRDAALSGDRNELEAAIDFPTMRESFKAQITAQLAREAESANKTGADRPIAPALVMMLAGPMVDSFVTSDSIGRMIRKRGVEAHGSAPSDSAPVHWTIKRDGLDRFWTTPDAPAGGKVPTLLFSRHGLRWKLAGIELPEGALASDL